MSNHDLLRKAAYAAIRDIRARELAEAARIAGNHDLLPCPFCGFPARLYQPRAACWAVTCTNGDRAFEEESPPRKELLCFGQIGDRPQPYGSPEKAAAAWNRRSPGWRYLPELPTSDDPVEAAIDWSGEPFEVVEAWLYPEDGEWRHGDGCLLHGVYAWRPMPEPPPLPRSPADAV